MFERWEFALTAAQDKNYDELNFAVRLTGEMNARIALEKLLEEPISNWPSPILYVQTGDFLSSFDGFLKTARRLVSARSDWHEGIWSELNTDLEFLLESYDELMRGAAR